MTSTSEEKEQALQAVLDRLTSYQDSAAEGTVEKELRSALEEVGLDLTDDEVARAVTAIEKADAPVSASDVLA